MNIDLNKNIGIINYSPRLKKFSEFCVELAKAAPRVGFTLLASQMVSLAGASEVKTSNVEVGEKALLYTSISFLSFGALFGIATAIMNCPSCCHRGAFYYIHPTSYVTAANQSNVPIFHRYQKICNFGSTVLTIMTVALLFTGLVLMMAWALFQYRY